MASIFELLQQNQNASHLQHDKYVDTSNTIETDRNETIYEEYAHYYLTCCTVLCASFYITSVFIAKWVFPRTKDIYFAADAIVGILYYPLLVVLAFDATSKLHMDVETRWFGFTDSSKQLAMAIVSRMFVHLFFIEWKRLTRLEKKMMQIHHLLCITVYSTGLLNNQCHFWGSFAAMCEVSNVFMNNMELWMSASDLSTKDAMQISHADHHILYKVNVALLLVSFALFRIFLFPLLLFVWLTDVYAFPETAWEHPNLGFMEKFMYPMTTIIIFVLSVRWFIPLCIGNMATFGYRRTIVVPVTKEALMTISSSQSQHSKVKEE